jgi:hypothetical protein
MSEGDRATGWGSPGKCPCQKRLGHKKIGTTRDTYAHVPPSMLRDVGRQLAALLHRK